MGAAFEPDTVKIDGLDKLLKALKGKPPVARVGILSGKDARKEGPGNAEIGAAHEYGVPSRGLPARSFLRMPLSERLGPTMESSGLLGPEETKEVLKSGTVVPWLKKVAVVAEGVVREAFETQGFGKWKPWKDPNYTNNAMQVLVDTGQLKNSITSEVKE